MNNVAKRIIGLLLPVFVFSIFALVGCQSEEELLQGKVHGDLVFVIEQNGQKVLKPFVENGETVFITLNNSLVQQAIYDGIVCPATVHFMVDGVEIAKSIDSQHFFTTPYTVTGLSVGNHTLSATVTSEFQNAEYSAKINPLVFQVMATVK